jgi:cytidyltransferase-like protein
VGFQDLSTVACIHGRFQPFHLGHVDYLKAALNRWPSIIIGIAAPTPVPHSFPGVEHRNRPSANPLTYLERTILIRESCRNISIPDVQIEFSPFPIDEPTLLPHYVGKSIVCATTRLYAWNDEKIRRLEDAGYRIAILDDCIKAPFDGTGIRKLMAAEDPAWRDMVLPPAAQLLTSWKVSERIRSLASQER